MNEAKQTLHHIYNRRSRVQISAESVDVESDCETVQQTIATNTIAQLKLRFPDGSELEFRGSGQDMQFISRYVRERIGQSGIQVQTWLMLIAIAFLLGVLFALNCRPEPKPVVTPVKSMRVLP